MKYTLKSVLVVLFVFVFLPISISQAQDQFELTTKALVGRWIYQSVDVELEFKNAKNIGISSFEKKIEKLKKNIIVGRTH